MSDRAIDDLDQRLQPLCQQFLDQCNTALAPAKVFIDQTYRDEADQNADYAKGRTAPGDIITNAQYGESPHNCTLPDGTPAARAFDFAVETADGRLDWNASDPLWQKAIAIGEALGLVSGSTFHCGLIDSPHFELPNWRDNGNI